MRAIIRQTVLSFKLEKTNDLITPRAVPALLGEFAIGLDLLKKPDRHLSEPGSGAGYASGGHLFPLMLMQNGGGRSLEDLRQIGKDDGLRKLLKLNRMPSSDTTGDFLRCSFSNGGLEGLGEVNRRILQNGLKRDGVKGCTPDIDATVMKAAKRLAAVRQWFYGRNGS